MPKLPFFMITGFLGSGKTTLLKNLLHHYSGSFKIGILQNEFGPSGIDSIDLMQTGLPYAMLEINNGSVFCVCLLGDFMQSLAAFIDEKQPDIIVLETSGLSDPIAIAQLLQMPPLKDKLYLAHVWCVIDCYHFHRIAIAERQAMRQVMVADTVILNKTDRVVEDTASVAKKIREWNSQAGIVEAQYCRIGFENVLLPYRIQPCNQISGGGWFEAASDNPRIIGRISRKKIF